VEFHTVYRALVRFRPLGEEYILRLIERPEEGRPLVAIGLDDGWIAVAVGQSGGELDYEYVVTVAKEWT
jgi:hypothetical protein